MHKFLYINEVITFILGIIMNTITLYTHNGAAHADEVFACAILSIIYPQSEVVRTRDPEIIEKAKSDPDAFLLDIGLKYEPENLLFDHHQTEGAGYRDKENKRWPYATAGLIWKHYGEQAVLALHPNLDKDALRETFRFIDLAVLRYIDAADCGVRLKSSGPSLSSLIASFNTSRGNRGTETFPIVKALSQEILINFINRQVGKITARNKVRSGQLKCDGKLLVLDSCIPWSDVVINEMPEVQLVVYPVGGRNNQKWQVRTAMDENRQPKMSLPKSWGGHERGHLASISGASSALFCHRSGHLAGAENFDCIVNMAKRALEEHGKGELVLA